jgi:hypothetical protein
MEAVGRPDLTGSCFIIFLISSILMLMLMLTLRPEIRSKPPPSSTPRDHRRRDFVIHENADGRRGSEDHAKRVRTSWESELCERSCGGGTDEV